MLASDYSGIKPDLIVLGKAHRKPLPPPLKEYRLTLCSLSLSSPLKALSGGTYPVSAVLADDEVMLTIKPGQHGSTYGGNPVAAKVAIASLEVLKEENLAENSMEMGQLFRAGLEEIKSRDTSGQIKTIRGQGLLNAMIIEPKNGVEAWDVCMTMSKNGLLAKPTHGDIIRFAPPLVINRDQINDCLGIIETSLKETLA